ncbi:hypothetical protein JCM6882_005477 [Rhodosporidiobolus microsporus]
MDDERSRPSNSSSMSRQHSGDSQRARSPGRAPGGSYGSSAPRRTSNDLPPKPTFDSRSSSRYSRYDDRPPPSDLRRRHSPPPSSYRRSPSPRRRSPGPSSSYHDRERRRSPSPRSRHSDRPPSSSSYYSSYGAPPRSSNGHGGESSSRSRYDDGAGHSGSSSGRRTSLTSSEKPPHPSYNGSSRSSTSAAPVSSSSSRSAAPPRPSSTSYSSRISTPSSFNKLPAFFYKPLGAKDFRVLYDPSLDPNPIKKGKEVQHRYDGEGVPDGPAKDPRKTEDPEERARLEKRRQRGPFMKQVGVITYSWDKNSTGPPPPAPPCAVLVTGFPSTVTADALHAHFRAHGRIESQDVKYDPQTGGSLGICWIKFVDDVPRDAEPDKPTREKYEMKRRQGKAQDGGTAAAQAVAKGNGAKVGMAMLMGDAGVKVVFDGDGALCKAAVKAEMDRRHPPKPKPVEAKKPADSAASSTSSSSTPRPSSSAVPAPPSQPPPPPPPSHAPPPPPSRLPLPPQASAFTRPNSRFDRTSAQPSPPPSGAPNGPRFAPPGAPGGPRSMARGGGGSSGLSMGPRGVGGAGSREAATHVSLPSIPIPPLPPSNASAAQISAAALAAAKSAATNARVAAATHVSVPSIAIPPLPPRAPPSASPTAIVTSKGAPGGPKFASGRSSLPPVPFSQPRFGRRGGRGGPGGAGGPAKGDSMASAIAQAVEAAKKRLKMQQQQQQQARGPQFAPRGGRDGRGRGREREGSREEGEADMEMDSDAEAEAAAEAERQAAEAEEESKSGSGSGAGEGSDSEEEEEDAKDTIFYHHASGRVEPRRILPRGIAPVGAIAWQASKKVLQEKLHANGRPYLKIEKTRFQETRKAGQGGRLAVPNAEELERHFGEYEIDRTFADSEGWYVTFTADSSAKNAYDALNDRKFSGAPLELLLCDPPSALPTPVPSRPVSTVVKTPTIPTKTPTPGSHLAALVEKLTRRPQANKPKKTSGWTDEELVEEAKDLVVRDLLDAFQNDIKIRLVRGKVQEHLQKWEREGLAQAGTPVGAAAAASPAVETVKTEPGESPVDSLTPAPPSGPTPAGFKSLSSLSFAKRKSAHPSSAHDDHHARPRDRERHRRESTSTRMSSEAPSESPAPGFGSDADERRKAAKAKVGGKKAKVTRVYSSSEESSEDERAARRKKDDQRFKSKKKSASAIAAEKEKARKARIAVDYTSSEDEADEPKKLARVKEEVDTVPVATIPSHAGSPELGDVPPTKAAKKAAAEVKKRAEDAMDVDEDEKPKPQGKLVRGRKPVKERQTIAMPTSYDPFEAGLVGDEEDLFYLKLALERLALGQDLHPTPPPSDDESAPPPKHASGAARTEGFYTITVEEKMANRPASNRAKATAESAAALNASSVAVSRLARANTRGLVRGMELHKKVTATDTDVLKFNQLKTRKKQLTFSRSGIEGYGLFAREFIPAGDMVIEYVGELIRQQVADRREKAYERQGIGSSYLFRVDEDLVVDATKKGNLGRLINHCCAPNCTARIITINGVKKIVIYAKSNIEPGEEVTYDYHFPIEEDNKIPCLCGAPTCRRFLN